jgi:hyperosmotically inducible protein
VYRAIYDHPMLNRFAWQAVPPIQVIVKSDHVTLDSVVANEADKDGWGRSAEKRFRRFSGTNNLRVENSDGPKRYSS